MSEVVTVKLIGNAKRLAQLFRDRAAIDLEIAEMLEQEQPKRPRKRAVAEPTVKPSPEAIERTRRILRRKGVVA